MSSDIRTQFISSNSYYSDLPFVSSSRLDTLLGGAMKWSFCCDHGLPVFRVLPLGGCGVCTVNCGNIRNQ